MRGYVQVYTGNGKGKTTAALGLCIRAASEGLKVFFAQFIKMGEFNEIKALKRFDDLVTTVQFGKGRFLKGNPSQRDVEAALVGLEKIKDVLGSGEFDVVILDEANIAVKYNMISENDLLELIRSKPKDVELIITGRDATPAVIEKADLVTEMREIKHYYHKGVKARVGIEK